MAQPSGGAFDPDGPIANEIATLSWVLVGLGVLAFVVFAVVLVVALFRGRESTESAEVDRPDRFITLGGVAFPTVVLVATMGFTVQSMRNTAEVAADDALVVEVIGHRWWYEIRYPEAGVETANEVHLPVGRPVEFHLTSADVIHSFWIPQLGGKLDLLPQRRNTLVLEADEPQEYRSQCAEFCGLQHAKMALIAVAEPPADFERWLAEQARPAAAPATQAAARGEGIFRSEGCARCHAVSGSSFDGASGPDLTHLASRRSLAAGTLTFTRLHLERWLTDPQSIKEGADMPPAEVEEEELEALLQYLESLR